MPTTFELLHDQLRAQRRHVLGVLDGLDEGALRRPVLPSGWSCLGLMQHLALDVERFWFGAVVAGDEAVVRSLAQAPNAWLVGPEVTPASVLERYRLEATRADEIIARVAPDAAPRWWPTEQFGDFRLADLGAILLHVVVETATHAGHLDAARELIDRRTWLVLSD